MLLDFLLPAVDLWMVDLPSGFVAPVTATNHCLGWNVREKKHIFMLTADISRDMPLLTVQLHQSELNMSSKHSKNSGRCHCTRCVTRLWPYMFFAV